MDRLKEMLSSQTTVARKYEIFKQLQVENEQLKIALESACAFIEVGADACVGDKVITDEKGLFQYFMQIAKVNKKLNLKEGNND